MRSASFRDLDELRPMLPTDGEPHQLGLQRKLRAEAEALLKGHSSLRPGRSPGETAGVSR